jgi:PAS domain S-box-containing protein
MSILHLHKRLPAFQAAALAFLGVLLAGLWIATLLRLDTDRRETITQVQAENANLAVALEAHTLRTLKGLDQLLVILAHEIEAEGLKANVLFALDDAVDPKLLATVYVTDVTGRIVKSSGPFEGVDLSDREQFQALAKRRLEGMFIGRAIVGRMTGKTVIPIARAYRKRDGSFGGIVGMGVDPTYFTDLYSQMHIGQQGYVQIMGTDGMVLVRRVGSRITLDGDLRSSKLKLLAARSPSGSLVSNGRLDGITRFVGYRVVQDYPLIVSVGQAEREALAPFEEHRRDYLIAAGGFSVVLLAFGLVLWTMAWREGRATAELSRNEALHRVTFDRAPLGITYNRPDGKFIDANRAYCAMVGYSREELLGMTYMDLVQPEQLERLPTLRAELDRASRLSIEAGYMRRKGGVLNVAMEAALLRDDQGRPELIVAIVQDITDRERARAEMQEQLDELRRFQQVAVDRELRMMEIEAENGRLKKRLAA